MSERRYFVRPKGEQDLEDQAYYYATTASPEVGHRFLIAAHDTIALLANQPHMGWPARLRHTDLKSLRVFRVKEFQRILLLYFPLLDGVEIVRVVHSSRHLEALLRREGLV